MSAKSKVLVAEHESKQIPDRAWVTISICTICVVIVLAGQSYRLHNPPVWLRSLGSIGLLRSDVVWSGAYWRLILASFAHGHPLQPLVTVIHLGLNLLGFLVLGQMIEDEVGHARTFAFFSAAAFIAGAIELAVSGAIAVGISGVIYAFFGFVWMGRKRIDGWNDLANRKSMAMMLGFALMGVVVTRFTKFGIANGAHFGGMVMGMAAGGLHFSTRPRLWYSALAFASLAIATAGIIWVPWQQAWCFFHAYRLGESGKYRDAIWWYNRCLRLGGNALYIEVNKAIISEIATDPRAASVLKQIKPNEPVVVNITSEPAPHSNLHVPDQFELIPKGLPEPK